MSEQNLAIRSRRVVTDGGVEAATVHIDGAVIERVGEFEDTGGARVIDAGDAVVMAGLVDTHVHINEPGRTHWEGFETATRAAAAGGVTTLVDMPLNCVPATTDVESLQAKIDASRKKCRVDVGFWGGVVPGNADQLRPLFEAGVLGFKSFLCPSGVEEFQHVGVDDLREAMPILAEIDAPLLCHAEHQGVLEEADAVWEHGDARHYGVYLASRPRSAEDQAIALLCELAEHSGCRLHIVHLSSATALDFLRLARGRDVRVTVETCPHYLYFGSDDVATGATAFKCAPPIRPRGNADELWKALGRAEIDLIATDHSPSPPERKCLESGRFDKAWGGIASLQLSLPIVWTSAKARGFDLSDVTRWLSRRPAELAGLSERKGRIAPGFDADLVVWEPDAEFIVDQDELEHRHKLTPYDGRRLQGRVEATYLRGKKIYQAGEFIGDPGGEVLLA